MPVRDGRVANAVSVVAQSLVALAATGVIRAYRPDKLFRLAKTLAYWGTGPAGGYTALAIRMPTAVGVVDDAGALTFDEIHRRTNAVANALAELGVQEGDVVGLLARNHRGFVDATVGVAKLGADVLYLNTGFAGPQLVEVLEREQAIALVYDEEFAPLVDAVPDSVHKIVAWHDAEPAGGASTPTLDELIANGDDVDVRVPDREGRAVIMTSGTTGSPKGASRGSGSIEAAAALVSRLPLRHGWTVHVAAPLFHTWGWAHLNLSMLIGSSLVLRRRFDPEDFLRTVTAHDCDAAVVVPVMLQRVLELPDSVLDRYDLSTVKAVAASGSALPGELSSRWMDRFGDHLYNIYGSTECAWVTIASPADLRAAPGNAGRVPIGTTVRLLDADGHAVPDGDVGRVHVANALPFEGYTGGSGAGPGVAVDGLMPTGDLGRWQDDLLFVEGRGDEMVVSGGENVYPSQVEECLGAHPGVVEVAVTGVDDDEYGQRLSAYVVRRSDAEPVDEETVRSYVKQRLSSFAVPRDVYFVDELPRNETGKVVKHRLTAS
jgi:acyl-CoA synthetase (AMP-forming)/AMP-acid ligase II